MCGIFCYLEDSSCNLKSISELERSCLKLISRRGPDASNTLSISCGKYRLVFTACVLWLQGEAICEQPLVDPLGNILAWNGDIYEFENDNQGSTGMSDTQFLSGQLERCESDREVLSCFEKIKGPWAFIYWQKNQNKLWFGRDFFGRQSLLIHQAEGQLVLSSLAPNMESYNFSEVAALGIYEIELDTLEMRPKLYPWCCVKLIQDSNKFIVGEHLIKAPVMFPTIKEKLQNPGSDNSSPQPPSVLFEQKLSEPKMSAIVTDLLNSLRHSVMLRIKNQPDLCKLCVRQHLSSEQENLPSCSHVRVGVLFSGGLDSAVIAALAAELLPPDQCLDLYNVSFQQAVEFSEGKQVPDRITGLNAYKELQSIYPERRFNFVHVDVSKDELQKTRRDRIKDLLHPLDTVLDDSIGCAIWFAARGEGMVMGEPYVSPARVLLLGMGIDEQLAGYARHRTRYQREGLKGLQEEINMELLRISERNLGRDNRIVADHGVAPRFPFLDENFVNYLTGLELEDKVDLDLPRGVGEKLVLRLAAWRLGLRGAAAEPKRAVQFGSRIAKMENRKEKATDTAVRI